MGEELIEFWPMQYELLAAIHDTLSSLLVAFLRAYGAKNVPDPQPIPRPVRSELGRLKPPDIQVADTEPLDNVISFSRFAEMMKPR